MKQPMVKETVVERWDTFEIALQSDGTYDNPSTDVELTAERVGPMDLHHQR